MNPGKIQIHILYFTQAGADLAAKLTRELTPEASVTYKSGKGCCKEWTAEHFRKGNVLVYIGACGIAVRAIAPHIGSKDTDPAVIVIDGKGENVIPILAGHLGGANEWARKIAECTKGKAVLTTATDVNGVFAVDLFAKDNGLLIGDLKKAGRFTASLLEEGKAGVVIPRKYADLIRLEGEIPGELKVCDLPDEELAGLQGTNVALITPDAELSTSPDAPLRLIPRCVILGMGCRKGKSYEELRDFAEETLRELGLGREAVCAIASIDVKKEEPGLVSLAADLGVPLLTFSAEELEKAELENWIFTESDRVREHVGTGNVCERAAVSAGAGKILRGKTAKDGMTMLIVTHEMRFARDVSTRIFFMNEGIIYEDGTPEQIFEHPVHSATKAFVNRIQKLVYEIDGEDFDYLQIRTGLNQFFLKYNLSGKAENAYSIISEMLFEHLGGIRPLTFRITFAELSGETALDFMIEGASASPIKDSAALDGIRQKALAIVEEPTARGFRIKILI